MKPVKEELPACKSGFLWAADVTEAPRYWHWCSGDTGALSSNVPFSCLLSSSLSPFSSRALMHLLVLFISDVKSSIIGKKKPAVAKKGVMMSRNETSFVMRLLCCKVSCRSDSCLATYTYESLTE